MRAMTALVRMEGLLFLRNPVGVFMALLLPVLLLLLQGFVIPGTLEPLTADGLRMIDFYVPVAITIATTSVAVTNYPSAVAGYRETGVLRRLGVTPVGAHRILFSQWIVSAGSLGVSIVLAFLVAGLAFGTVPPAQPVAAAVITAAGALAMMALGSLIAAVAGSAQAAYGMGFLIFMASMLTAGMWSPGPLMSEGLAAVSSFTPLGAMAQALTGAWFEGTAQWTALGVLAAWTVPCALLSARIFRWS